MTYEQREGSAEGMAILKLVGPLTLSNMFELQRELQTIKPPKLIFDMEGVPYMDSAGLGVLMNFYVSAERNGRRMALAGVNPRVDALLEMTRVRELLRSFRTVAEAEAAI